MSRPLGPQPCGADEQASDELDVRDVPKPLRHPLIFERFAALAVDESFVLVNSHDPKHLRAEFERDQAGLYDWDYLPTDDRRLWRIRITRRRADGSTAQPPSTEGASTATAAEATPAEPLLLHPPGETPGPIDAVSRWELFGGAWRVVSKEASQVTVALCRCDGGEEQERVTSADPEFLAWLGDRTGSEGMSQPVEL